MPGDGRAAEARLEALEERLGERDFGEQNQRLLALAKAFGDRFEIDLGLARPGHSVEQDGIEALADRGCEARRRLALVVVEVRRRVIGIGQASGRSAVDRDGFERAGVDQAAQHRVADSGVVGELADRALPALDACPAPSRAAASAGRERARSADIR